MTLCSAKLLPESLLVYCFPTLKLRTHLKPSPWQLTCSGSAWGLWDFFFFFQDLDAWWKKKKPKSFSGIATAVVLKCFGFILRLVFSEYLFLHLEAHEICMVSLGDAICIERERACLPDCVEKIYLSYTWPENHLPLPRGHMTRPGLAWARLSVNKLQLEDVPRERW